MQNIEQLMQAICQVWIDADHTAFEKYYDKSIQAEYYGKQVSYKDIENRLNYIRDNQTERQLDILELVHQDNKVVLRCHYHAIDRNSGLFDDVICGFYEFNDQNKIIRIWAYTNQVVDY